MDREEIGREDKCICCFREKLRALVSTVMLIQFLDKLSNY
jgi:hypothetical protein